ncbi:MAG: ABC transporter substrate-binding protein [Pseudomonadota bacterium]
MNGTYWLHGAVFAALLLLNLSTARAAEPASAALQQINAQLSAAIADDDADELCRRMAGSVAVERVSQRVFGQTWQSSDPTQRAQLKGHLLRLLVQGYASAMTDAEVRSIEYRTQKSSDTYAVVIADIPTTTGSRNRARFRLAIIDGRWLVTDVMVEGISLVSVLRSSYKSVGARLGIDGLLAKLEQGSAATGN